jgi:hypothetical protein
VSTYIPESVKAQIEECDSEALLRSADRNRVSVRWRWAISVGIPRLIDT